MHICKGNNDQLNIWVTSIIEYTNKNGRGDSAALT